MTNPNDATRLKHLDSLASHVNVLDTTPQNTDGKLWFEVIDGEIIVKMFYGGGDFEFGTLTLADPTVAALVGDTIVLGRRKIRLNGFASDLTIFNNTFYAASDTNHETPLGTVTFQRNVDGEIIRCTLTITDSAALAGGDTVSIEQIAGDSVTLVLSLHGAGEIAGNWDSEYDDLFDEYLNYYFSGTGGGYSKTADTTYTSTASGDTTSYQFELFGVNYSIYNDISKIGDYVSVDEIRGTDGKLTQLVVTVLDGSILEQYSDAYVYPVGNSISTAVKLGDAITPAIQTTASLVQDQDSKIYTFTAKEQRKGYYETTGNLGIGIVTYYRSDEIGGDFCTIDGLADGLTLVMTDDFNGNIKLGDDIVGTVAATSREYE